MQPRSVWTALALPLAASALTLSCLCLLTGCGSPSNGSLSAFSAESADAGRRSTNAEQDSGSAPSNPTPVPTGTSNADSGPPASASSDGGATCPYTGPPVVDPTTLPACEAGGSHCEAASEVPSALAAQLATCPTGVCVPDIILSSGGEFIPQTCTSLDGAEGRCMNLAFNEVTQEESLLPQDVCQTYERCVPCYSPIDGSSTGACNESCDPGPSKPAVLFQSCCTPSGASAPAGSCVPASVIPASEQADLDEDGCSPQGSLCVPTEMIEPGFAPQPCSGSTILGGYTGVCLSTCLDFGSAASELDQGNCDNVHVCVPCTNPESGDPTGAPGCM
jgi:hypothetical protein